MQGDLLEMRLAVAVVGRRQAAGGREVQLRVVDKGCTGCCCSSAEGRSAWTGEGKEVPGLGAAACCSCWARPGEEMAGLLVEKGIKGAALVEEMAAGVRLQGGSSHQVEVCGNKG